MIQGHRFDAVLFDLDGVLVDSQPWWHEARVRFATGHGRVWTDEDERHCLGGNSREWAEVVQSRLALGELEVGVIVDEVVALVAGMYRERPAPVIGDAPAQVRRIAGEHAVAIASSSHPDLIRAAVAALGLGVTIETLVSSDHVATGKPAPDVYLLAAARLGVPPARCLVVEDSVNGARAGRAAGMTVVLVSGPGQPAPAEARDIAHHVVPSLAALDPDRLRG